MSADGKPRKAAQGQGNRALMSMSASRERKKRSRVWLRFRLRTLFVAITLLCIPLGWFAWVLHRANRQRDLVAEIVAAGGTVSYEFDKYDGFGHWSPGQEPPVLVPMFRHLLGRDFFFDVVKVDLGRESFSPETLARLPTFHKLEGAYFSMATIPDECFEDIARLQQLSVLGLNGTNTRDDALLSVGRLTKLERLVLSKTEIKGESLRHLRGLQALKSLQLDVTDVDDESLKQVAELESLEMLTLSHTKITDAGMTHLARLPKLRELTLDDTNVGDAGLENLQSAPSLKALSLYGTKVTPAGARRFNEKMGDRPNRPIFDRKLVGGGTP